MDYMQTAFQYYPASIKQTKPIGNITLFDYLKAIKHPKEAIKSIFKQIEVASANGDLKLKAELKSKLYYFTPCVTVNGNGRKYDDVTGWTGLMVIDFDGLDKDFAVEFKKYLFETYDFMVAVFLSASKKGIKCIARIPVSSSIDEFKSYFYGLMDNFQYYQGIDFTSKNCVLANYLTYDEQLLYRLDAKVWDRKGMQLNEFNSNPLTEYKPIENITEDDAKWCINIASNMINRIVDNGHGQVVATASLIGGFVGSGYISRSDAEYALQSLIRSNHYLSKGTNGYIKTAMTMLEKGISSPVLLDKHKQ